MNMKNVSFTKLREGKWHVCTRFAGSAVDNALGCVRILSAAFIIA